MATITPTMIIAVNTTINTGSTVKTANNNTINRNNSINNSNSMRKKQIRGWLQRIQVFRCEQLCQVLYKFLVPQDQIGSDKGKREKKKDNKEKEKEKEKEGKGEYGLDGLWGKNQYFMQALTEIADDLLWSIYGGDGQRNKLPTCLIAYYQLTKHLIHQTQKLSTTSLPLPPPGSLPNQLERQCLGVLLRQSPVIFLKQQVGKLQEHTLTAITFKQELLDLINARFQYLTSLYCVQGRDNTHGIVRQYFQGILGDWGWTGGEGVVSVDLLVLGIVYGVYRMQGLKVLMGDIVSIYEQKQQTTINRSKLLTFYNTQFLIQILPLPLMQSLYIKLITPQEHSHPSNQPQSNLNPLLQQSEIKQEDSHYNNIGLKDEKDMEQSMVMMMRMGGISLQAEVKEEKSIYDMFQ